MAMEVLNAELCDEEICMEAEIENNESGGENLDESLLSLSERVANILLRSSESNDRTQTEDIYELPDIICLKIQRYKGETSDGQINGEGVASFHGGHEYKGIFSKGLMEGFGTFTQADGVKYEGDFVCNLPMGQGTFTWLDGSTYTGDISRGIRHGMGTYKCPRTGMSYSGQWDHGKRHGKGKVYYDEDQTSWYDGDWVVNKRDGWGERGYPSGNTYTGEWRNNLRHGEGTMNWTKLGQQYVGSWKDGVQHGLGTHTWFLKRIDGSQYAQSNQYSGEFFEGQRHGKGIFYYAGGAIYTGEWRNNKKHGQGKLTARSGRVFECDFDDDLILASLNEDRASLPLGILPLSDNDSKILGSDMAFNIQVLLNKIPQRDREAERMKVESVVMSQHVELRLIFGFYSKLGISSRSSPPDNIFLLSHLQFWRLLKDCNIHRHGVTLTQIERLIREEGGVTKTCSPFTFMPLHEFLMGLVTVAYYIYREDLVSEKHLLAACFSKLMTNDVLPNARNVKGLLFSQPDVTEEALKYLNKCWEIFQYFCRIYSAHSDETCMTCRHLLRMFKDLRLFDQRLTTTALLGLLIAENCLSDNWPSRVELEIVFLEFFEVLLDCAELKFQQVFDEPEESAVQIATDSQTTEAEEASGEEEAEATAEHVQEEENDPVPKMESEEDEPEEPEEPQPADFLEDHSKEKMSEHESRDHQEPSTILTIQQFFTHCFFPAVEHHILVTRKMEKLAEEVQNTKEPEPIISLYEDEEPEPEDT
ncbi:radial spoke head 10 homolog B isoform X3 [Xiphophorus hellerii]|uniref:radial spoke head 10 homolog B isoform X3 n=1 Tax=Xiphophorus hellerii TaxID=8084 RepID=UPI0013B3D21F|nr:radial spoke head 10 homolog B2 isoform X3 [Xiphophorus hellerii]